MRGREVEGERGLTMVSPAVTNHGMLISVLVDSNGATSQRIAIAIEQVMVESNCNGASVKSSNSHRYSISSEAGASYRYRATVTYA